MKLIDINTLEELDLPDDLIWKDEFSWANTVGEVSYSLTGALIYEVGERLSGRPITLSASDDSMGWVSRSTIATLRDWITPATRKMKLKLEYPSDTREFVVMFKHGEDAVTASPVKPFPGHENTDWFKVSIKLLEVEL